MIIYPSLPSGHTVFCDDIRHEVTGKITFVGSYGSHMFVGNVPATIPKICCAVTYRESPTAIGKVSIRVIHTAGDDEESVLGQVELEVAPDDMPEPPDGETFFMREAKVFFEISPFVITGPGMLKVRAFRDDNEIRLGALVIAMAPQDAADSSPD